jgi:hypothetical protein
MNTWSVKYGADVLPTKKNMMRRGHSSTHICPCCGAPNENSDHKIQCRSREMVRTYEYELDKVRVFLQETTSREIEQHLLELMDNLRKNRRPESNVKNAASKAVFHQYKVGVRTTLNGIWLQEWTALQDEYHRNIGSRRSTRVWLIRLSQKIQSLVHHMWLTRNDAIHNKEDSNYNKKKHADLDK